MLFQSSYADFQVLVRSESIQYHPATGVETGRIKALTASFGNHGGTFSSPDPMTGQPVEHAIIHGHFFDSEAAAEQNGWTDEEREGVEHAILKLCREQPFLVAVVEHEEVVASKPWPSFDEQTVEQILAIVETTGLVREALDYEVANKNRSTLVAALEEALATPEPAAPIAGITL